MLLVLGLFFICVQVNRSAGGVLANYLDTNRGFSPTDIGAISGAMFFAAAAAQIPTGLLFDRIGARLTLVSMSLVSVTGMAVFALAETPALLASGRFLIGFGHGGVISGVYLLAMGWSTPDVTARSTAALVGLGGGIGGVLATTPLALSMDAFGLSSTFLVLGAATLAMTLAIFLMVRDRPADTDGGQPPEPETLAQSIAGLIGLLRMPELRRLFVMGICFSAPFMTIGGLWAGPYFRDVQNMDAESASFMLLVLVVALHVGTYAYGPLISKIPSRKVLILGGVTIEILSLSVLAIWPTAPLAIAVGVLFLFGCAAPFYVALAAHARAFVPARRVGRLLTSINLMGLTGIFVMQMATGAVIDAVEAAGGAPELGFRLVFLSVIVLLVITGLIYVKQPEKPAEA
jgi:MFS family permease